MKSPRPNAVPKSMQAIYDAIVALTDAFCHDHLTVEYRDLARAFRFPLTQAPKPVGVGAAAHLDPAALGRLNFPSDKATQPYMTVAEVCTAFGVSQSTASAKANVPSTTGYRVARAISAHACSEEL